MSAFGGGGNYQGGGNNYRGGGGGGGGDYRGGGGQRGGGRGRRGGGRQQGGGGGRSGERQGRGGGVGGTSIASTSLLRPCTAFTTTGVCRNTNCHFAHIVTLHGDVDASSVLPESDNSNPHHQYPQRYNDQQQSPPKAAVSSVAIWESGGIKIFTGGQDGFWRLWNTAGGQFGKEFESNMAGKVQCVQVVNNFLFCGFEAVSRALPTCSVGMVHAWNLQQPNHPPAELQIKPPLLPYAHNQAVTALHISSDGSGAKVFSGSRDGSVRVWTFQDNQFVLIKTLVGHAREVTGLVYLPTLDSLWTCSTDACIRIWNLTTGDCQYAITRDTLPTTSAQAATPPAGNVQQQGIGHSHAITSLISFQSPAGIFILSASLDRTIKAWNSTTGECLANELHDEGVVCMSLAQDQQGNQVLLIGLESGNIQCRNLVQTNKVPAFRLLFTLSSKYTAAHNGAVKSIASGPAATFYTVGDDGRLLVYQFTGDMGLN